MNDGILRMRGCEKKPMLPTCVPVGGGHLYLQLRNKMNKNSVGPSFDHRQAGNQHLCDTTGTGGGVGTKNKKSCSTRGGAERLPSPGGRCSAPRHGFS